MTKAELVSRIALKTGYDKITVFKVVEAAMKQVKSSVAEGDNVYLRGFGSFITKTRARKIARNISKNTSIEVPEHKIAAFKPSDDFNALLR